MHHADHVEKASFHEDHLTLDDKLLALSIDWFYKGFYLFIVLRLAMKIPYAFHC